MRELIKTKAFNEFYDSLSENVQEKIDYISEMMKVLPVVNTKFVKKLENSEYYEMRISVDNEYRTILFTADHQNFMQATKVLLMNGFMKKSTKDYKAQIAIANKIKDAYYGKETEHGKDSEA